jgi:hypothetical protein
MKGRGGNAPSATAYLSSYNTQFEKHYAIAFQIAISNGMPALVQHAI